LKYPILSYYSLSIIHNFIYFNWYYKEQANIIGNILAYRAAANANASNQIAIMIPCHRIINNNGKIGGYAGGSHRKKYLINHEASYV